MNLHYDTVSGQATHIQSLLDRLTKLRQSKETIERIYENERDAALTPSVRAALEHVDKAYLLQIAELSQAEGEVEKAIKAAVSTYGHTVKGSHYQAVWSKGRVIWQDDFLQGYAAAHPEILQARRESEPSVSIRKV